MNIARLLLFYILFCALASTLHAQSDSLWQEEPELELSGFVDVYYAYDLNEPATGIRQPFFFNHNRHNEFNLNLGLLQLAVVHPKYRAKLALQTGTYANDNYAAEPGLLKNVFEANIGLSLNQKNSLWLDAGVLPSHMGFESALSIENPTLTRSLVAESSPYFLAGARLSFKPSERWELAGLLVNGWQRIRRLPGNSLPSLGSQLSYRPSKRTLLNWSAYLGTDDPDSTRRMRYFNNLYGQWQLSDRLMLIAGFDFGLQQASKGSGDYQRWLAPVLIAEYALSDRWKTTLRAEYYQDEDGVIIATATPNGFQTTGLSLNLDYTPSPRLMCRIEGRWLSSRDEVFQTNNAAEGQNLTIAASLALKFAKPL